MSRCSHLLHSSIVMFDLSHMPFFANRTNPRQINVRFSFVWHIQLWRRKYAHILISRVVATFDIAMAKAIAFNAKPLISSNVMRLIRKIRRQNGREEKEREESKEIVGKQLCWHSICVHNSVARIINLV